MSAPALSRDQLKRRLAAIDFRWPEESDAFSWDDAFDVADFWADLGRRIVPDDLPPFLVRAFQFGPDAVQDAEVEAFERRQRLYAGRGGNTV